MSNQLCATASGRRPPARAASLTQPLDFDRTARIAALTLQIKEWTQVGASLSEGDTASCVVAGVCRRVTRREAFARASDAIEGRDALLMSMSERKQVRLMRDAGAAFRLSRQ